MKKNPFHQMWKSYCKGDNWQEDNQCKPFPGKWPTRFAVVTEGKVEYVGKPSKKLEILFAKTPGTISFSTLFEFDRKGIIAVNYNGINTWRNNLRVFAYRPTANRLTVWALGPVIHQYRNWFYYAPKDWERTPDGEQYFRWLIRNAELLKIIDKISMTP